MTAQEMRETAVRLMKSRRHKNNYTNGPDRVYFFGKPDNRPGETAQKGFSDCSSAVRAAIRAASGIDIGWNTDAQVRNRQRGLIVHESRDGLPDEALLRPGDCLYFRGNPLHAMQVGHVEMYTGPNELYGHGGGTGPSAHALDAYCRSRAAGSRAYFMTIRWITDDAAEGRQARDVLRRGMRGDDVRALQEALIARGVSCGPCGADGDFGPATEEAVRCFQRAHGLAADGEAGPLTRAALEQADGTAIVARGTWTVRRGPGVSCAAVGYVRGGDSLTATGQTADGWLGVLFDGEEAWISRKAVAA